jgi:hypothetical protein
MERFETDGHIIGKNGYCLCSLSSPPENAGCYGKPWEAARTACYWQWP